ncbi:MAG: spermidine synthase [Candidatus Handelsmanbacteria bacterium RIFCSPLOWO2_12_FULL_64_10]|uniref:Polyamine aminopropyltransferase n=1 Tax=Handelsmanbacteria sp. (strain RIFCSPLOWO2_12_FULL_64_10) TaxID=1817868 RepID=A0A1F6CG92_HANXR|nr:MAG: spermidine synthase [Candidatus Handelsmanbacteria bacterium RIFCSPLOWO2_12_FULL_64_10]
MEKETFGYVQGVLLKERLFEQRSPFQSMQVIDSHLFGRCLVLDGALQTSEWDEFMYHEMLVHVPLLTHPSPRRVLIIGGGDGGALRRVLDHPHTNAVQVEIDASVIKNSQRFLPSISKGAFENPRANVVIGNGFEYIREHEGEFDVVLVDSTDPVGAAVPLFQEPFYRDVFASLKDDGLLAAQSNSPIYMALELKAQLENLREVFPLVRTYLGSVPAYPGGLWSYTIASKRYDPTQVSKAGIAARLARAGISARYYSPDVHHAAFVLPPFIAEFVS